MHADKHDVFCLDSLRHLILRAPCLLPAVAVTGVAMGGVWWSMAVTVVFLAFLTRQWRVALGCLVCMAIVLANSLLQERSAQGILAALERDASVTLQGTVVRQLSHGAIVETGGARVAVYGENALTCGDEVELTCVPRELQPRLVLGMFDVEAWMRGQGICARLDMVRCRRTGHPFSWAAVLGASVRVRGMLERYLMPEGTEQDVRRQVLCALVLGDKDGADTALMWNFRSGGCMHAFAVSGLHVGLVAGLLLLVLRMVHTPPAVARWVLLCGVAAYVWVTGMAVPAMRAYLMLAAVLGARILVRQVSLLNIWCFAGLIILLFEPWQVYQSGFQLSFAIYAAICIGVRLSMKDAPWFGPDPYIPYRIRTDAELRLRTIELWVRGAVLVSLCAWVGSIPLTFSSFHAFNTYGVLTNIAITPVLPVVMAAGLLALCCSGIPFLCWVVDTFAVKASGVLIAIVSFFAGLPYSYIPACGARLPHEGLVLRLHYGNSVCMLGNPGLLIDCGSEMDVCYSVQPLLFHDGFSPAAMLETRKVASRNGGSALVKAFWPSMSVFGIAQGEVATFETEAGRYRIYGPPADISPTPVENACPIVAWWSARGLIVYIGDASLATLEGIGDDFSDAVCVILGHNKAQTVDADSLIWRMPGATVVLLPSAIAAEVKPSEFAPLPVQAPAEEAPLLRLPQVSPLLLPHPLRRPDKARTSS